MNQTKNRQVISLLLGVLMLFGNGGVCRLQPAGNGVQDVLRDAPEQQPGGEGFKLR